MLKFTYTETDVQLERLAISPEELVAQRVTLAMRVGRSICVEPSQASFLLPSHLSSIVQLEAAARKDPRHGISLCIADAEFIEVSLAGTWIAENSETAEGIFVAGVSSLCEMLMFKLWQVSQSDTSCIRE